MKSLGHSSIRSGILSLLFSMSTLLFFMLVPLHSSARVMAKDYLYIVKKTSNASIDNIMKKAEHYLNAGHSDTALVYYMVVCNRMNDNLPDKDKRQCALAYLKKGNIFYMKGNYAGALSAYFSGLRIYSACKDKHEIGRFYNNIANVYCVFGDYVKGLEYYKKGYESCHKYGDKANEYKILANMTKVNIIRGNMSSARKYYKMSEKVKNPNDNGNCYTSIFNLGFILMSEKNYREAINTYNELLDYAVENKMNPRYLCSAYEQLYKNYMSIGDRDSTLKYMHLCESTAVKHGILHVCLDVLVKYADYYDSVGNYKAASSYRARYQREKDSIYDTHEFEAVKNEQLLYEMNKYDEYIASLNAREKERLQTISRQRLTIAGVTVVTAVIGVLLLLVYRQKGKIDKSYNDLFVINRDFVKQQEFTRQRMLELNNRLKSSEAELSALRASQKQPDGGGDAPDAAVIVGGAAADGDDGKNKTLAISEDMRRKLLDAVIDVMESFKSYTTFVELFRKVVGITPSMYKDKLKASV